MLSQNSRYYDGYLDLSLDLSDVTFVVTRTSRDALPRIARMSDCREVNAYVG